jgi:type I restriction enzyme, R subunit
MCERNFVERPFFDQLAALEWPVIDQGPGVPTDPAKSKRTAFREGIRCRSMT